MADIEKTKTGIFEMLQRNTWQDIDEERHRFQPVLNDALELLKEQTPRVLSKSDILCNCPDYVYMEVKDGWVECCIMDAGESTKDFAYFSYGVTNCFIKNYKDYGRTWRCWTVYPTQEQRKAVKWE